LGDYLGRDTYLSISRAAFDYLFFWVFTILIFSMVSGVIIDTFGAIRDEQDERKEKLSNYCFISGLPGEQIDKAGRKIGIADAFREHIEYHQNKWDYASFIFYIQVKNAEDCTGLESYANELLAAEDNRWIPSSRSMFVEQAEDISGHTDQKEEGNDTGKESKDSDSIAQLEQGQEKLTSSMREIDTRLRTVSDDVEATNAAIRQLLNHHGLEFDVSPSLRRGHSQAPAARGLGVPQVGRSRMVPSTSTTSLVLAQGSSLVPPAPPDGLSTSGEIVV
jgi:hypothetical protein